MVNIRDTGVDEEQIDGDLDQGDGEQLNEDQQAGEGYTITTRERTASSKRRDDIADAMWLDYLSGRR